jgi:hypothetical protein
LCVKEIYLNIENRVLGGKMAGIFTKQVALNYVSSQKGAISLEYVLAMAMGFVFLAVAPPTGHVLFGGIFELFRLMAVDILSKFSDFLSLPWP